LFHPNPEKEVDKLFTIMDVNKDGFIDYKGKLSKLKEFCNETLNCINLLAEKNINKAFQLFDIVFLLYLELRWSHKL
jgi:hypothetical protein